jgi:hypothetical protein
MRNADVCLTYRDKKLGTQVEIIGLQNLDQGSQRLLCGIACDLEATFCSIVPSGVPLRIILWQLHTRSGRAK